MVGNQKMTALIILQEAKHQPVCHNLRCRIVSASSNRHCSCSGDLCSHALFSERHREPGGAQSSTRQAVGEGTAHLCAEQSRHTQLSHFLTARWNFTCDFILGILEAPWKRHLSRVLDRFIEHETNKEHSPEEARPVFQRDGVLEASGFFFMCSCHV